MKNSTVVNGVTLSREQVEAAVADLNRDPVAVTPVAVTPAIAQWKDSLREARYVMLSRADIELLNQHMTDPSAKYFAIGYSEREGRNIVGTYSRITETVTLTVVR